MRYILGIAILFSLVLNREIPVYASQIGDKDLIASNDSILNDYDFDGIDESLAQIFPQEKLDFKETVRTVLSGDIRLTAGLFNRLIKEQIGYAFGGCRSNLVHMILLSLMAALFINFSNVFQNKQISEISFYVIYLMMIALAINSFQMVIDWVSNGVDMISRFMSVFCPIYFVAVSVAKGSVTAASFYHLVIFLIYLVELIISKFLLSLRGRLRPWQSPGNYTSSPVKLQVVAPVIFTFA